MDFLFFIYFLRKNEKKNKIKKHEKQKMKIKKENCEMKIYYLLFCKNTIHPIIEEGSLKLPHRKTGVR